MKHYCHYHPLSIASWNCPACNVYFDKLCLPDSDSKRQEGHCPLCRGSLRYLDRKAATTPFWHHNKKFVEAILAAEPLLLACVFGILSIALNFNLVISLISCTVLLALIVNSASILAQHILLAEPPPSLNQLLSIQKFQNVFVTSLYLLLAYALPITLTRWLDPTVVILLMLPIWFIVPALLITQIHIFTAQKKELGNVPAWVDVIKTMNLAYAALSAYLCISYLSMLILHSLLTQFFPALIANTTTTVIATLILWFNFCAIGYILKRYERFNAASALHGSKLHAAKLHGAILHDANSAARYRQTTHDSTERKDADLDIAVKHGDYDKALALLEDLLKKSPRSDFRRQQLYLLLSERKDLVKLEQYAESLCELLLGRGQQLKAYELISTVRESNPNFVLYDMHIACDLADAFDKMKEFELVIWLAESSYDRIKPSEKLAELYLRASKVLLSKLNRPMEAKRYLSWILKHSSNEESTKAANRLLEFVSNLKLPSKPSSGPSPR